MVLLPLLSFFLRLADVRKCGLLVSSLSGYAIDNNFHKGTCEAIENDFNR